MKTILSIIALAIITIIVLFSAVASDAPVKREAFDQHVKTSIENDRAQHEVFIEHYK